MSREFWPWGYQSSGSKWLQNNGTKPFAGSQADYSEQVPGSKLLSIACGVVIGIRTSGPA
jgi:hypothetical protein